MGCIMTPMPNHLSTRLSSFSPHPRGEDGVERMKGRKECGSHTRDGEEKGRSVKMA